MDSTPWRIIYGSISLCSTGVHLWSASTQNTYPKSRFEPIPPNPDSKLQVLVRPLRSDHLVMPICLKMREPQNGWYFGLAPLYVPFFCPMEVGKFKANAILLQRRQPPFTLGNLRPPGLRQCGKDKSETSKSRGSSEQTLMKPRKNHEPSLPEVMNPNDPKGTKLSGLDFHQAPSSRRISLELDECW